MPITKTMPINEILKKHPETSEVFKKYKLKCTSCHGAANDTVENASVSYGIDMNTLLKDLNKVSSKKK